MATSQNSSTSQNLGEGEEQLKALTENLKLLATIKKGKFLTDLKANQETTGYDMAGFSMDDEGYKFNLNRFKCIIQYSISDNTLNEYIKKRFSNYQYPSQRRTSIQCQLQVRTKDNPSLQIISTSPSSIFRTPEKGQDTIYSDGLATYVVDAQLMGTWQTFTYASTYDSAYRYSPSTITLGGWASSGWNEDYTKRKKISGNVTAIRLNFQATILGDGLPTKTIPLPMGAGGISYQMFIYGVQDILVK